MAHMSDEIVLAKLMTTLDFEFKRDVHYHNEGYESDTDYGLPPHITSLHLLCILSRGLFNQADYTAAQHQLSPFTLRPPRGLPF